MRAVTIKSKDTPFKDMMSPTRPMTDEERAKIEAIVQEMYERFVDVVAAGRSEMTRAEVRAAASGEIYSASQALELGLIDAIGAGEDAYRMIVEMLEIESVRVVEHRRIPNLFDALFRAQATPPTAEQLLGRLLQSTTGPRMLYYWQGGR